MPAAETYSLGKTKLTEFSEKSPKRPARHIGYACSSLRVPHLVQNTDTRAILGFFWPDIGADKRRIVGRHPNPMSASFAGKCQKAGTLASNKHLIQAPTAAC